MGYLCQRAGSGTNIWGINFLFKKNTHTPTHDDISKSAYCNFGNARIRVRCNSLDSHENGRKFNVVQIFIPFVILKN